MRRWLSRGPGAAALACAMILVAGCSPAEYETAQPWQPQLDAPPPVVAPPRDRPVPDAPDPDQAPPSGEQEDQNVVADGLDTPWGLALLPNGNALVGERRTGRILQVFADRSEPQVLMTIEGLDATGDGGLLGLALSPRYVEDALVYAYVTTPTDNRILRFSLGGVPQAIVTGLPKGPTGNGGRLYFGVDGALYVGTGDTGDPALAGIPANLAGKVLRFDIFGDPIPLVPEGTLPVYTIGHSSVTGFCTDGGDRIYVTDAGQPEGDELNLLSPGEDYGWPDRPSAVPPVATYPDTTLGGCAVLNQVAFLGDLAGERIVYTVLDGTGAAVGDPQEFLNERYGRLRTVVVDTQGALWITTSNKDGGGEVDPTDDRVLRIQPPAAAGGSVA